AHGRKLKLMRGTAWAVRFMGLFTGLVKKAFGNLTYDMQMSAYKESYCKYALVDSIVETEKE
ncbi:MAG: NAD-dependent epimerase, partial [Clostridiales bacterium]|nr:NAD-dependent epimerase [Clostridiales bacterium]